MRAWLILCCVAGLALPAAAHEGHDHADQKSLLPDRGDVAQRLPDGGVFLPKPAQRRIGVRTLPVAAETLPRTLELAGTVIMDPHRGGRVQAMVTGRLEAAGPHGLPAAGSRVRKGQVLAWVVPASGGIERANQAALLAELKAARELAGKRLARLRELADTVPRKVIEEAEAAVANEQLVAPVSGVIASANVVSGQVLEARETLFEIVNPERLLIEALAFDMAVASDVAGAFVAVGEQKLPLRLVGVARSLREQALPLTFRGEGGALAALAVGQPVRVFVQTRSTVPGIRVPMAALMKNPANQSIVWVKTAPERFEPRTVTAEPLDGTHVAVTSGLKAGDRIAVRAATLINQIR